jgi:hypothetical protein
MNSLYQDHLVEKLGLIFSAALVTILPVAGALIVLGSH